MSQHLLLTIPHCRLAQEFAGGGVGVVEAPIADTSLADGLFLPSPLSGICMTGMTRWRGGRTGIPLFLVISIMLAMVQGFWFFDGRLD